MKNAAVCEETMMKLCVFSSMCLRPGDSRWHSLWLDQQQSLLQWLPQSDHQLNVCGRIKPHSDRPGAAAESHCIRSLQRVCVALCFDCRWNYSLDLGKDCQTLPITWTLFCCIPWTLQKNSCFSITMFPERMGSLLYDTVLLISLPVILCYN